MAVMATTTITDDDLRVRGLHATTPQPLPFAPRIEVRAYQLERDAGNLLIYSTGALEDDLDALLDRGGVERQYLNHWHEALFGLTPEELGARLLVHDADRARVEARTDRRVLTFSRRHHLGDDLAIIPTPGHTPGATAYLWDAGDLRLLFTGDTLYLDGDELVAAVLDGSDRAAYLDSLEAIRELDFDVLVPWGAAIGGPSLAAVTPAGRRRRIDAVIARVRRGEDR